jgi:fatty acid desaturase
MGILIALIIILSWLSHSAYMLMMLEWNPTSFGLWLHVALQTYLSVGLFITAHDAMHGTVSLNKRINNSLGWIACFLFAGMNYKRLITNHMAHHTYPGTEKDPDYDMSQNYVIWFLRFMNLSAHSNGSALQSFEIHRTGNQYLDILGYSFSPWRFTIIYFWHLYSASYSPYA